MSSELDEIFSYLYDGKVPPAWQKAYLSLKPLASWTYDLILRIEQFRGWAEGYEKKREKGKGGEGGDENMYFG